MDNFILNVPKWQGELVFSKEMILFVLIILLVIVGILLCICGYKYFQTISFMGMGGVICYIAYKAVERMTSIRVIQMALSVALTFFGVCVIYFISIILGYILEKIHLKQAIMKGSFIFSSVSGGVVLGFTIYYGIYHHAETAAGIGVVSGVLGMLVQYKNRRKRVQFKTYHDVLKMELPKEYLSKPDHSARDEEEPESEQSAVSEEPDIMAQAAVEPETAVRIETKMTARTVESKTVPESKRDSVAERDKERMVRIGIAAVGTVAIVAVMFAVGATVMLVGRGRKKEEGYSVCIGRSRYGK